MGISQQPPCASSPSSPPPPSFSWQSQHPWTPTRTCSKKKSACSSIHPATSTPAHFNKHVGALGGKTMPPGTYTFTTAIDISGSDCTISGESTDTWIFVTSGGFNMAAGKKIVLAGGAQAKNIVWAAAGGVTLGTTSHLEGIILGKTAATFGAGSTMNGRVLVQTAVTLDNTKISEPNTE